jgi:tRNA1(Val) A37 N6-methylase TrmN6
MHYYHYRAQEEPEVCGARVRPMRVSSVLELGAGCGLAGFYAAKRSKQVVITDGNEV